MNPLAMAVSGLERKAGRGPVYFLLNLIAGSPCSI